MYSVKIGPFHYNIYYSANVKNDRGEAVDGYLAHDQNRITIDDGMCQEAKLQVLLHEIIHEGIEIQRGQDVGEGLIDAIAYCWIEVMRENPDLVRMITK